ncbi:MAG: DUF1858 domain-containing protein [Lachnospiraceae bacterium]|nr:DUF1858 domain-containing protein [Lachnospiraceae bacterium]
MAEMTKEPVNKEMLVGDILRAYPDAAEALMACGMGCIYCPASQAESLADASAVHGLDPDAVTAYVNEQLGFEEA